MDRHEAEDVVRFARRDATVCTFKQLMNYSGVSRTTLTKALREIGEKRKLEGLFALRKYRADEARREELLAELQRLATVLQRTPSVNDIEEYGDHHIAVYRRLFGGVCRSQEVAALPPNEIGHPGHLDRRPVLVTDGVSELFLFQEGVPAHGFVRFGH